MARRTTLVLLALAVLSALVAAYLILRPPRMNESERYRDGVTVLGHKRVLADSARGAYAYFVGDELSDSEVAISVSAPLVRWFREQTYSDGDLTLVVEGYGNLNGVRCFVKVQRIRPKAAVRIIGARYLTAEQQAGLNKEALEALKIMVLCDPQDSNPRDATS
jgi:hypothetical protein